QCVTSMCFHLKASAPCIAWLSTERMIELHALVETNVIGTPPFTYRWMNGETTPFILARLQEGQPRGVSVIIEDANGCSSVIHQTLQLVDGRPQLCAGAPAGFSIDTFDSPFSQFNTAEIRYTDADGTVYSSGFAAQQEPSMFSIDEVGEYGLSPDGFPVKRIRGKMHCTLFTQDGEQSIRLDAAGFSIGVTYQQ
ncbi:MAG: hypothetical protein R3330_03025, partial [Saprospiraceae bacterium]|nr:hypothetical protein [Saprospiraceae bacterium]